MPASSGPRTPTASYHPPLTPVSEAESDTTETASTSNATDSSATSSNDTTSDQSYFRSRPLNFSRPRPSDNSPQHRVYHDHSDSTHSLPTLRSIQSHHERSSSFPTQPDFRVEFDQDDSNKEVSAAASDSYAWDLHLKDVKPERRLHEYDAQRSQPRALYGPARGQPTGPVELAAAEPRTALPRMHSAKTSSIPPQTIPRIQEDDEWDGEDANSHHTVSENGDIAELEESTWMGSNHDISSLTDAEIKKLRKKGINPALYVEMKAARRGKGKWLNPLSGNSYLS